MDDIFVLCGSKKTHFSRPPDFQPSSEEVTPSSNAKNSLMDVKEEEEEEVHTRHTRVLTNIMGLSATSYVVLILLGLK
jgi:hypothetical protein